MQQGWAGAKAIASRLSVSLLCVVSICFLCLVYNEFAQGPISFQCITQCLQCVLVRNHVLKTVVSRSLISLVYKEFKNGRWANLLSCTFIRYQPFILRFWVTYIYHTFSIFTQDLRCAMRLSRGQSHCFSLQTDLDFYLLQYLLCIQVVHLNQGQLPVFFLLVRLQVGPPLGPVLVWVGGPALSSRAMAVFTLIFAENKVVLRVTSSLGMTDWHISPVQLI